MIPAGREVGEHLVRHRGVDKIAFTGSTAAGRTIASICGEQLKRVSLELGGKSAAIILDDADLAATVEGLKFASLMNSGQACVAQTRILASRSNYDDVVDALATAVSGMSVGDPDDPTTEIGPLVAERQQERVDKYIALGQEEGARLVVGGNGRPDGISKGWYVQPTVFADVTNDMRIAHEEIFGPVLAVIPFDDVEDAVRIANDSEFGLAGSVWTGDADGVGMDVARRIRTGTFGVNQYSMDFVAPFGGYKASGIGREFGKEGFEHYLELKSIVPGLRLRARVLGQQVDLPVEVREARSGVASFLVRREPVRRLLDGTGRADVRCPAGATLLHPRGVPVHRQRPRPLQRGRHVLPHEQGGDDQDSPARSSTSSR